ncbi:hypothetical protein L917_14082, partial [Phytophthora nicotianae]
LVLRMFLLGVSRVRLGSLQLQHKAGQQNSI